jgi:hypothetical protein
MGGWRCTNIYHTGAGQLQPQSLLMAGSLALWREGVLFCCAFFLHFDSEGVMGAYGVGGLSILGLRGGVVRLERWV